ncbi:right-handed parallel beta-helix repeat-containing protein, partial [candidate division KSB1 bacterium]
MKRVFVLFLALGLLMGFSTGSYAQAPDVFVELETTYAAGKSMSDTLDGIGASTPVYVSIWAKNLTKFVSYDIRLAIDKTKVMTGAGEYAFETSVLLGDANALGSPFGSASFSSTEDLFSMLYSVPDTEIGVDAADYVFLGRLTLVTTAAFTTSDKIEFTVSTAKFLQGTPRAETTAFTANSAVVNPTFALPRPTTLYVDDDYTSGSAGGHTWGYDAFADIATGLDSVATAGTIMVAAGTYAEDLTIDKSVTLTGASAASVTVTGNHTITANDVTIGGFTFDAAADILFTLSTSAADISGISFSDNTFDMLTGATVGIWFGNSASYAVSDIAVDGCTFTGPVTMVANPMRIGGWFGTPISVDATDIMITNNTISYCSMPINLQGADLTNIVFDGNTFSNTDGCVYIWGEAATTPTGILSGFEFVMNTVESTNSYGLAVGLNGIFTDANFGAGNIVRQNSFAVLASDPYGLKSVSLTSAVTTYTLDAKSNWWGDTTGPTHTSNATGVGAAVSDDVDFEPWFADALMTTLAEAPEDVEIVQEITEDTPTITNNFADNTSLLVEFTTGKLTGLDITVKKVSDLGTTTVPSEKVTNNVVSTFEISLSADSVFTADITFTYDPADVPVGTEEDSLAAAYYDGTSGEWVVVTTTVDTLNKTLAFTTDHFSVWAVIDKNDPVITGIEPIDIIAIPDDFRLDDNYPNPFNPTTTISFHLAKSEIITLRVYNASGQLVKSLVNNELTGAGS